MCRNRQRCNTRWCSWKCLKSIKKCNLIIYSGIISVLIKVAAAGIKHASIMFVFWHKAQFLSHYQSVVLTRPLNLQPRLNLLLAGAQTTESAHVPSAVAFSGGLCQVWPPAGEQHQHGMVMVPEPKYEWELTWHWCLSLNKGQVWNDIWSTAAAWLWKLCWNVWCSEQLLSWSVQSPTLQTRSVTSSVVLKSLSSGWYLASCAWAFTN